MKPAVKEYRFRHLGVELPLMLVAHRTESYVWRLLFMRTL